MCCCDIFASAYTSAGPLRLKQNGVYTFAATSGHTDSRTAHSTHKFHDRSATMRGLVDVQVCCRGLRSGEGKCGHRHTQQEENMCNMRMTFARTLATWASEPNGFRNTQDVSSVFITSVSHDRNCTATLKQWFQYFCLEWHEITTG